jgi:23S rRNA (cytidine2498-2'-O)-methyltransferase
MEADCACEIQFKADQFGIHGQVKTQAESGYVLFRTATKKEADSLYRHCPVNELIFARQVIRLFAFLEDLPEGQRIEALISPLHERGEFYKTLSLDFPDADQAKSVAQFLKKFEGPLKSSLEKRSFLRKKAVATLHLYWLNSSQVYLGYSLPELASPWHNGIVRLKFPPHAPSRSCLKLEEAFLVFYDHEERAQKFRLGRSAVDLGASPGGWTWQLVQNNVHVTAIDNGPIDEKVMQSGLVKHLREDGFTFKPPHPVDYLVCDMVDKPLKVADLIAKWLVNGWCKETIFNLKLPMKQRFSVVQEAIHNIEYALNQADLYATIQAKQLYHDRDEITLRIWTRRMTRDEEHAHHN